MSFASLKPQCEAIENKPGCIQSALCILGDKWTPLLIGQLVASPKTFGELETVLVGISPRTLSARLLKLQDEKIVVKTQYKVHPPRFTYQLTEKGQGLQEILSLMATWGEKHRSL